MNIITLALSISIELNKKNFTLHELYKNTQRNNQQTSILYIMIIEMKNSFRKKIQKEDAPNTTRFMEVNTYETKVHNFSTKSITILEDNNLDKHSLDPNHLSLCCLLVEIIQKLNVFLVGFKEIVPPQSPLGA